MVDDVGSLVFGEFVPKQRMSPREGQTCQFYVFVQAVFSAGRFFQNVLLGTGCMFRPGEALDFPAHEITSFVAWLFSSWHCS